ncbi:hypothetical protein AUJ66_03530 [Candidatus Desantisbacteria bacterium CG1_02_38_46]|nr:MAG: hypothetical protein AUJ66_03530 [Candidatus Desantisbacteria bacterium CG1_02_38_46]
MKIIYSVLIIFSFLYYFNGNVCAGGETLSLEQCIKLAFEHKPGFRIVQHNMISADWTLKKAYAGSNSSDPDNNYSAFLSLEQYIYDFGRSRRETLKAKESNAISLASFEAKKQEIIYNVTQTYYSYLKAKHIKELNSESLKKAQQYLFRAKGFYEVGTKPRIDVTRAEVDVANTQLADLKAQNSLKLARLELINAIGLKPQEYFEVEDRVETSSFDISLEQCMKTAFSFRVDLKQQGSNLKIAQINLDSARNFYNLSLSARTNLAYCGQEFPLQNTWSWGAGLNFSVPVFNGFSKWLDIKSAKENLSSEIIKKEEIESSVGYEIEQIYLSIKELQESIEVAKKSLIQAQENLLLAEGRYISGVSSMIELADARVLLKSAQVNFTQSIYDYAIAVAKIKKSMGVGIVK